MKTTKLFFSSAFLIAMVAGSAQATVYIDNFNSGYTIGDLNGQNGWVCSDPTADIGYVQAIGGVWGSRSASIGYVSPIADNSVYLSHSASTPLIGDGVDATFSAQFQVIDSDSGYGDGSQARDTFGLRLQSTTGTNLFTFYLNPTSQVADPENQTEYNSFSWSTGTGAPTVALAGRGAEELYAYTLTVHFFSAGGSDVGFNADVNGAGFSGVIPGAAGQTIGSLGATWDTLNGAAAPGSNFMVFDNVSLVPEPSVALLGVLGASFAFTRRRRA